jgi:site-specific recombinase XerD
VERFLVARRAAGYRGWLSARGIAPLLEYLEAAGLAIAAVSPEPQVPGGDVLAGFRDYLVTERGLAGAVPSAASASPLPESVGPGQAGLLLGSCDRGTAAGLRDYAVLVLLVRLGLRVGEVAAMQLGDIGWRAGQVTIRGKGSRLDQLPLPADAGQAIAAWLRGGRPGCSCRQVFTTLLAPLGPLTSKAVSAIVTRAARRAGLAAVTAHRLRHGAATGLLRAGASLPEVGQVLRHASMLNTARYARVDHAALAAVARPWPGAVR